MPHIDPIVSFKPPVPTPCTLQGCAHSRLMFVFFTFVCLLFPTIYVLRMYVNMLDILSTYSGIFSLPETLKWSILPLPLFITRFKGGRFRRGIPQSNVHSPPTIFINLTVFCVQLVVLYLKST